MPRSRIPHNKRHLKPQTHSVLCKTCNLTASDCEYEQMKGGTIRHRFERRTTKEQASFDILPREERIRLEYQAFAPVPPGTAAERARDISDLRMLADSTRLVPDDLFGKAG